MFKKLALTYLFTLSSTAFAGPYEIRAALEELRAARQELQNTQIRLNSVETVLLGELATPAPRPAPELFRDSVRVPFIVELDCKENSRKSEVNDAIRTATLNAKAKCERACGRNRGCNESVLSFIPGVRNPNDIPNLFTCLVSAEVSCR